MYIIIIKEEKVINLRGKCRDIRGGGNDAQKIHV